MKHCPHCNVEINANRKRCPLCYGILEDDKKELTYQPHPKKAIKEKMSLVTKLLLFLSLVVVVASIFANLSTLDAERPLYWCVLVVVGVPYIWLSVRYVILFKGNVPTKIFTESIATIILIILVEIIIKIMSGTIDDSSYLWSINYVVPSILVLTSVALFIVSTVIKKYYCDSIMYLFVFSLLEGIYFLLFKITSLIHVNWMGYTCGGVALAVLLAMFIFHFDDTKEEFIKRFHI
ncbi:MAG: hypothetical protein J1F32_01880 [Erysipelotrichales bacterium]|nr:hypothetical protein [Erysipelotrichales bacterium]